MLKTVYAENSEQFLWEKSEQFYLMQKTDFMNTVTPRTQVRAKHVTTATHL